MTAVRIFLASLVMLAFLSAPRAAQAAESYDNCTGFIDSIPTTISTQGVWCLRKDLSTAITSGNAITIATNNVTIDCNDFKVGGLAAGPNSSTQGISADNRQNATIRHCNIRGFFTGIRLTNGAGNLIEDNRLDNNLYRGIFVDGDQNVVQRNRVFATGGTMISYYITFSFGIVAYGDVIDNLVDGVFATDTDTYPRGIMIAGTGGEVRGNRVRGLVMAGSGSAAGIYLVSGGARVANNQVSQANATSGNGIYASAASNYCSGNTIYGFSTPMAGCTNDGGNGLH